MSDAGKGVAGFPSNTIEAVLVWRGVPSVQQLRQDLWQALFCAATPRRVSFGSCDGGFFPNLAEGRAAMMPWQAEPDAGAGSM